MSAIPYSRQDYRPFRRVSTTLPGMGAILAMFAATALYLAIELPFASALVDLFRSSPTSDDVHRMETTGRVVSGLALALVAWGIFLPKWIREATLVTVALRMALVAGICVVAMCIGQKLLLDAIVENSSPESRQSAVRAMIVKDSFGKGIDGDTPSGASLVGLSAFMAWSDTGNLGRMQKSREATASYALASVPDAEGFWRDAYRPLLQAMESGHPGYVRGVKSWQDARPVAMQEATRAWNSYQWDLRKRNVRNLTPDVSRQIRRHVRHKGIYVRDDWHPMDRAGFEAAAFEKGMSNADYRFDTEANRLLGAGPRLPKNLGRFEDFWNSDAVQARIKARLGLADMKERVPLVRTREGVASTVMPVLRRQSIADVQKAVFEPATPFQDGGPKELMGKNAVRAAFGPLLALALSALGAAIHILKLSNFGLMAVEKALPIRGMRFVRIGAVAALAAILAAWVAPSGEHVAAIEGVVSSRILAEAMKWVVATHGLVHPIGEALSELPLLELLDTAIDAVPVARR